MADTATGRARTGFTRARLILLAVLVLGLAGGAAAYALGQEPAAVPAAAETAAPSGQAPSAAPASGASAAPPASTGSTTPPPQQGPPAKQKSPGAPDSAVHDDEVFVDPAAGAPARQWDPSSPPTCGQWRGTLSEEQQVSYATAVLRTAWLNDGSAAIPFGSTVSSYRAAMTAACLGTGRADDNMSDVARAVYAADPGKWGP